MVAPSSSSGAVVINVNNDSTKPVNSEVQEDTVGNISEDGQQKRATLIDEKVNQVKVELGYESSISDSSSDGDEGGSSDSDAIVITVNEKSKGIHRTTADPTSLSDSATNSERKRPFDSPRVGVSSPIGVVSDALPTSPENKKPRIVIDLSI